jgi:hypothetical protein
MDTQPDFEEFLSQLQKHRVDYMLVGGYAVAFHGYPRFTKDLNVFFRNEAANVRRLRDTLVDFEFNRTDVENLNLDQPGEIIRFGVAPVMIDLINLIDGISCDDAAKQMVSGIYGKTPTYFISKADLIKNKQSTSRLKDKADVDELM